MAYFCDSGHDFIKRFHDFIKREKNFRLTYAIVPYFHPEILKIQLRRRMVDFGASRVIRT